MSSQGRDAKGRFTDAEVEAVERHFDHHVADQAELDKLMDTFAAAGIVLGLRLQPIQNGIETAAMRIGAALEHLLQRAAHK